MPSQTSLNRLIGIYTVRPPTADQINAGKNTFWFQFSPQSICNVFRKDEVTVPMFICKYAKSLESVDMTPKIEANMVVLEDGFIVDHETMFSTFKFGEVNGSRIASASIKICQENKIETRAGIGMISRSYILDLDNLFEIRKSTV